MSDIATITSAGVLVVVIDLAIRLVALVIIPRDRLPTAAMAWLLAVFFILVIGVIRLLIGNPKLPEKRQLKQREMDAVIARESEDLTPATPQGRVAGVARTRREPHPDVDPDAAGGR